MELLSNWKSVGRRETVKSSPLMFQRGKKSSLLSLHSKRAIPPSEAFETFSGPLTISIPRGRRKEEQDVGLNSPSPSSSLSTQLFAIPDVAQLRALCSNYIIARPIALILQLLNLHKELMISSVKTVRKR